MSDDKVIRDGAVAVVFSPGFGAGWSSWSGDLSVFADADLVEWIEAGKPGGEEWAEKWAASRGCADAYLGGVSDLKIAWLPVGTVFRIDEYDGNESILLNGGEGWHCA